MSLPIKSHGRTVRIAAKRKYSEIGLREAMQLVGRQNLLSWRIDQPPLPPSDFLTEDLRRLQAFDLTGSEQSKTLLIDSLLSEIVPNYASLKIWKAAALQTDLLSGIADYLIAPHRAYLEMPLLCVIEAKRDDFERGRAQCVAEMFACRWNNRQKQFEGTVFGIVSNGQGWQFYKIGNDGDVYETELYALRDLPVLLGALDYICGECAKQIHNT